MHNSCGEIPGAGEIPCALPRSPHPILTCRAAPQNSWQANMFWKTFAPAFSRRRAKFAVGLAAPAARMLQAIKEDFDDNAR